MKIIIESLKDAAAFFEETLSALPERDGLAHDLAVADGRRPAYPAVCIRYLADPADTSVAPPHWIPPTLQIGDSPEDRLAAEIVNLLQPLDLCNPVSSTLGVDMGPGTLVTCWGIPLNPETENSPAYTLSLDALLDLPMPAVRTAGLMPGMLDRIAFLQDALPPRFRIGMPDTQGPFNLLHAMVGDEVFLAPYEAPDRFREAMTRITDFWIEACALLDAAIGSERRAPFDRFRRIAECSVNLVSRSFYEEHILPHDRRIAEHFGALHIHPCSGPHVFHATLDHLPVAVSEAGWIERTAAGAISVEEALVATAGRDIVLMIGQELPPGAEEETIRRDLACAADHPRITFAYTGMHWRRCDSPIIRALHERLDAYWAG